MTNWIVEFLYVLSSSLRTQVALMLAFIAPIGLLFLGMTQVEKIAFQGPLTLLNDPLRNLLMQRYDKAALFLFGAFLLTAFKYYRRDRRNFYGL